MDISVVIPLYNEEESLTELHDWIVRVLHKNGYSYEIIFIDDGSNDKSWEVIQKLHQSNPNVHAARFQRNYGKSAGLNVGFEMSKGNVVITMDADLQDSPEEIPELYKMIHEEGYDLVSGWKKIRHDNTFTKNLPSKLYNSVNRMISGIQLHDMNCGLKSYKSDVIKNIEVYGEMHRYIPVIAKWSGYSKIGEKVVQHQARKYGVSKFGLSRFIYGPLDLLTIMFMSKFGKRPMHFFGVIGSIISFTGLMLLVWLSVDKILFNTTGIANRPAFYLGILMVIVGVQLFIAGFLGELISRNSPERNVYRISEEL
ncbi:MAG TPA: glycosyltransferase family 2 protein [Saprospiraceae bacterium]|jgi:glycosyltransferase involved in cell wall biosynthesis|nr:glycosyltransferase family 2 protein [Saprospiraceae bacterium]HRO09330.1 glycosyltransferase family 2 protein [Saprospiraceae bacterium]HRP42567.1 glycosyltransferase family 2 protein [Saprospiraceae bacterium]